MSDAFKRTIPKNYTFSTKNTQKLAKFGILKDSLSMIFKNVRNCQYRY